MALRTMRGLKRRAPSLDPEVPTGVVLVCWDKLAVHAKEVESDGPDSVAQVYARKESG